MAISRHKVLSEMQQQLELASSKCGNLQKQLEIVKNKVRQSSATNLVRMELPENKENKAKMGESLEPTEANKETDYSQALSSSSSSSEEVNEERDVNIIKVFYDRLGQMEYPKGQVELSDISSVDNDLDIDQLLSDVNITVKANDRKGKKMVKKGKGKVEKTKNQKQTTSNSKIGGLSPYHNNLTKVKNTPVKKKNMKAKTLKSTDSIVAVPGRIGNNPASRGTAPKVEVEKTRKKKQVSSGLPMAKNNRKIFQEPIKRVMNLASQLRKTKSSTVAEKRESFADTRSLTRLHSETPKNGIKDEAGNLEMNSEIQKATIVEEHKSSELINSAYDKIKPPIQKTTNIPVRKEVGGMNRVNAVELQKGGGGETKISQDKGTSLSDLIKRSNIWQKSEVDKRKNRAVTPNAESLISMETAPSVIKRTDFKGRRSFDVKVPSLERRGPEQKLVIRKQPQMVKIDQRKVEELDEHKKGKTIVIPQATKPTTEVKKRVDMFEMASKEKEPLNTTRTADKVRPVSTKFKGTTFTRSNTTLNDISRKEIDCLRQPSFVVPPTPALRGAGDCKDPADAKNLTINQIKKMKDNLMHFNAIPFIVGQSTSKSYHIGLNIQETYSLFKQTPSMTALIVSKNASGPEHRPVFSRARSTATGYTGRRSVSSARDTCPACEPVPERSPEQISDPWAVPQDGEAVVRVCTCLPKRMISFDQVLNQLYLSNMNLVKLHPNFLPNRINEENDASDGKLRPASLPHRPTNTLYYTKLLRSIQNLKDNMKG